MQLCILHANARRELAVRELDRQALLQRDRRATCGAGARHDAEHLQAGRVWHDGLRHLPDRDPVQQLDGDERRRADGHPLDGRRGWAFPALLRLCLLRRGWGLGLGDLRLLALQLRLGVRCCHC